MWWNSSDGSLAVYYNDGDSSQWVTILGAKGMDGDNAYVYVAYASDASGTGFTTTFNAALDYIAILNRTTPLETPAVGDFEGLWKNYKGAPGTNGTNGTTEISFSIPGELTVKAGTMRWYFNSTVTVSNVIASVGVAPTGASVIFDVNKNGTTIFSTQGNRPTIAASGFSDLTSVPDVTSFASGDYITVDIDQIGSTLPGEDAVIRLVLS
jgi:hypothetical protein